MTLNPNGIPHLSAKLLLDGTSPGPWSFDREACDCGDGYACGHPQYVTGLHGPTNRFFADKDDDAIYPMDEFHVSEFGEITDADLLLIQEAPTIIRRLIDYIESFETLVAEYGRVTAEHNRTHDCMRKN